MGQPAVRLTWHGTTDALDDGSDGPRARGGTTLVESRQRGDARAIAVPHLPAAVSSARRAVLRDILPRVDATVVHETAVVVSELLGNAVRHARPLEDGRVLLRWQVRGGVVDVEVTDGGSRHEVRPLRPTEMSESGRGLRIVRHMAHEWGVVEDAAAHRTVWACLGGPSRRRRRP
jgi:anti-sigma regulatory factor (Ser/Thr protein kinase)